MNELPDIERFLAGLPAFDALPADALRAAANGISIAYFRRGRDILVPGAPNGYLHIVRSGAVELLDTDDALLGRLAEGECFGLQSVLNKAPVRFRSHAIEDSLVYQLGADAFRSLRQNNAPFDTHFLRALTERLSTTSSQLADLGAAGTRIGNLVGRPAVTIEQGRSIRAAAKVMDEQAVSALMITDGERMTGIVTDRDLRSRVVAAGCDPEAPIDSVMTRDPVSLEADAHAYDAALMMMQRGIHHLPVTRNGDLIGLVSRSDFMRAETEHPLYLVHDLGKQDSVEGIVNVCRRLPQLLARLIASDAGGEHLGRFITAITDGATRRLLQLAERELGPPPVPYAWIALGSQARHEQSAKSDQDNALIVGGDDGATHDDYFAALAASVNKGLDDCGWVYCPGDVMAQNPQWRQPLAQWQRYFSNWINEPEEKALMHANIFFDLRLIYGDARLAAGLQAFVRDAAQRNQLFLALMARNAQQFAPPLGFFRRFVLDRSGVHRDTLNLKLHGIIPIVEIARIRALACGQSDGNTRRRLRAAARAGELTQADSASLIDALDLIERLRLEHQNRQMRAGDPPDNHLSPTDLSPFVRHNLKTAFGQIRRSQAALLTRFGLG